MRPAWPTRLAPAGDRRSPIAIALQRIARDFWLNSIGGSLLLPTTVRARVLRIGGLSMGAGVKVAPGQRFLAGSNVRLDDGVYVNQGCFFDATQQITLGASTRVGPEVQFLTSTHDLGPPSMRAGNIRAGQIRVGAGSWIGARSTILPGVTVGAGCVIAAGSVVIRDCDADGLYAGVPATKRRQLPG